MFNDIAGYIIDLDGVFIKNFNILPGGKDFIEALKKRDIPFVFLTNLTTKTPSELHELLFNLGIFINKDQIISSSSLTRDYLKDNFPNANIKVFGSKALKSVIYEEFRVGNKEFDIIVIGIDPSISINDLSKIRQHISENKKVIFTNPDYYTSTSKGYSFECGMMVELFRPHLKDEPFIIGKPSKYSFDMAIKKLNIPREYIAMIGDNYETDIKGAHEAGLVPIHLQTTLDKSINNIKLKAHEYKDLEDLYTQFNNIRVGF